MSMDSNMDTTNYSLTKLLPEFSRLWAGDFTSPEGLSAVFIALLFGLAIFFSVMSVINYFRASRHVRF